MKFRSYQLSQVHVGDLTLAGYSVAGEESVIIAPELDVSFDIGKCPREALAMNHVLLSHGHADHVAGLPYYFAQRDFQGIAGGTALVPEDIAEPIEDLLRAWGRVEGHVPPHKIVPMSPGSEYEIRRGLVARSFAVKHVGKSVGYAIIDIRNKLKDEFTGLSGPQIVELKKQGVEVTRVVEYPLVAFLGDTPRANYSDLPFVANARALLLECTFFDPDHVSRARAGKHVHLVDLPEMLEGMNNQKVILIHVTRRTNMHQAQKFLKASLPKEVAERITFLMSKKAIEEE